MTISTKSVSIKTVSIDISSFVPMITVARALGVQARTVKRWCEKSQMPHVRLPIGNRVRFFIDASWLDRQLKAGYISGEPMTNDGTTTMHPTNDTVELVAQIRQSRCERSDTRGDVNATRSTHTRRGRKRRGREHL